VLIVCVLSVCVLSVCVLSVCVLSVCVCLVCVFVCVGIAVLFFALAVVVSHSSFYLYQPLHVDDEPARSLHPNTILHFNRILQCHCIAILHHTKEDVCSAILS
jgi:hypothetical protein